MAGLGFRFTLIIVTILLSMTSDRASAEWSAGLGGYTEMMGHLQSDSGSKNGIFEPNLTIAVGKSFREGDVFGFSPQITFTLIPSDDSHSVQLFALNPDFVYRIYENIDARFGVGMLFRRVSGSGGTVTLRNGATGTINGFRPGKSEVGLNFTLNLGFDFVVYENFRSHLSFYLQGILGGAALQANNFVGLSYVF